MRGGGSGEVSRPTRGTWWLIAAIVAILIVPSLVLVGQGFGGSSAPASARSGAFPVPTLSPATSAPVYILSPIFWGLNDRDTSSTNFTEPSNLSTIPSEIIRYPGGGLADRQVLYADGGRSLIYNTATNYSYAPGYRPGQFAALAHNISSQVILQVPAEWNNASLATQDFLFEQAFLGVTPAYVEIGNEPQRWAQFNVGNGSHQSASNHVAPTAAQYALDVHNITSAILRVSPTTKFITYPGGGKGDTNETAWITATLQANCPVSSQVAIHAYPDGSGSAGQSLQSFLNSMTTGNTSLNYRVPIDRAAIAATCPGVQLIVNEFGPATASANINGYLTGFPDALYVTGMILQGMSLNVTSMDLFCIRGGYDGCLYQSSSSNTRVSWTLYNKVFGKTLPQNGTSVENLTTVTSYTNHVYAEAMKNATQSAIVIDNVNLTHPFNVSLSALGFPSGVSSEAITWNNTSGLTPAPVNHGWTNSLANSWTLPPASLAVFRANSSGLTFSFTPAVSKVHGSISVTPAGNVVAQHWAHNTNSTGPSGREWSASAYDATDGYGLVFGGFNGHAQSDTWKYQNATWTNITGTAGTPPSSRYGAQMVFDAADGYVVLFGGKTQAGAYLMDTWKFSGGVWAQLTPAGVTPTARAFGSVTYDTQTAIVEMTGGTTTGGVTLGGVYTYAAVAGWVLTTTTGPMPTPRTGAPYVNWANPTTDSNDTQVLTGGYDPTNGYSSQTWQSMGFLQLTVNNLSVNQSLPSGSTIWATTSGGPSGGVAVLCVSIHPVANGLNCTTVAQNGRFNGAGVWSHTDVMPNSNTTVYVYGAYKPNDPSWNYTRFTNVIAVTTVGFPDYGFVYTIGGTVLPPTFGNNSFEYINVTGAKHGAATTIYQAIVYPFSGPTTSHNYTTDSSGSLSVLVEFSNPSTVRYSTTQVWIHVAGDGTSTRRSVYVYQTPYINRQAAAPWVTVQGATNPGFLANSSGAYDTISGNVMIFGGENKTTGMTNATWSWNGLVWTHLATPGAAPSKRANATMFEDVAAGVMVLYGGTTGGSSYVGDTWTWVTGMNGSISVSSHSTYVGVPVTYTARLVGGAGPYAFWWISLPTGCVTANTATLVCTPTVVGRFYATHAQYNDSVGDTFTTNNILVTVSSAALRVSVSVLPLSTVHVGESAYPIVMIAGEPLYNAFTYRWTQYVNLPPGCAGTDAPVVGCVATTPGRYPLEVNVTDISGRALTAYGNLTVVTAVTASLLPTGPVNVTAKTPVNFSVNANGGTGVYSFVWRGLPSDCASTNSSILNCTSNVAGVYLVYVVVTDSAKGVATTQNVQVTITSTGGGGGNGGGGGTTLVITAWDYYAVAIVLLVLALIVGYAWSRSHGYRPRHRSFRHGR